MLIRHKIIVKFQRYALCWEAHSDTLGEDTSPVGVGPNPAIATADLQWQLEEYEEKNKT